MKEPRKQAGRIPELVAGLYSKQCDGDRRRMLEMALRDLWGNHPAWPSTFGPCHNPDCGGSGRGSGLCEKCVTECIGEIIGSNGPAEAMRRAIVEARQTERSLREMIPNNRNIKSNETNTAKHGNEQQG